MIDPVASAGTDAFGDLLRGEPICTDYVVRARPLRNSLAAFGADRSDHKGSCMPGEANGALPNGTGSTLNKHGAPIYGPGCVYGAMSGDAGDAHACALF